jgi:hypothetical protein
MKNFFRKLQKYHYSLLFLSLMILIFLPYFAGGPIQQIITTICLSLVFLIAIEAVSTPRRFLALGIVIAVLLILLDWSIYLLRDEGVFRAIAYSFFLIYMVFVAYRLLLYIVKNKNVDGQVIMAAISVYLLLGLVGALLAGVIDLIYPAAYSISNTGIGLPWREFLYYSFVTLTTLGYGDIYPVIDESRALAMLLSIAGPFYLATVIAILISKFTLKRDHEQMNQDE